MKIEVNDVNEQGDGYCVVYPDEGEGESFGMQFRGMPVDDEPAFTAALTEMAEATIVRNMPAPTKQIAPAVTAMIGEKRDVVKKAK